MTGGQPLRDLQAEIDSLRRQLEEATDTLRAIRKGEIDAVVVEDPAGPQVYALETADHPYRVLVEQMNEGALILSREGFILHANPRFSGLVMTLPQDLHAASVQDWIAADDRGRFEQALALAFEGKPQQVELNLLSRPPVAAFVPAMVSLAPLNLNSVEGVSAVVTDLRERRQRESLERGALMARSIIDHATAAVIITDRQGHIERANAAAVALAGAEVIGKPFETAFPVLFDSPVSPNAPIPSISGLVQTAIAGKAFRGLQARLHDASRETVELQVSGGPFAPAPDKVSGAVFTLADVTALRTSERRFRALADSIPQIVWTADSSGRLEYCNSVGIDYFGIAVRELAGATDRIVHPDDVPLLQDLWRRCLQSGTPLQVECRLKNRWGEASWFLVRAVPVRDARGLITQWFGTSTDVDAQKRIENDLRQANADLERFTYAASHDFQEPLRMITTHAQLLQKNFGSQLQGAANSIEQVLKGTGRLATLLQNLLSYIRASRAPEMPPQEIDCNEVLREVLKNLEIPIQQSGANIQAAGLPRIVFPRIHMFELLQNLVSNAIRHRGDASPEIQISAIRNSEDWVFSIRDNGIGIAPQHQQNIFGIFQRPHGNDHPGTGTGLAICRKLVEQHRGSIWVQSQVNCGSVFYFSLPVARVEQTDDAAHAG